MAKRILVPLDETVDAEAVVPLVKDMAQGGGAIVRLLHVAPVPDNVVDADGRVVAYVDQEMSRLEAEGLDYLQAVELKLAPLAVECAVRFGDPTAEILREAALFDADLIAVTTRSRHALGRLALGSVAEQVLRKAEPTVMLVRVGQGEG